MTMNQRKETVEEYLRRGKVITKIPHELNTIGSWRNSGMADQPEKDSFKKLGVRAVSLRSLQPNKRFDTDDDDTKYWKQLDKRCDQLIKKIKCQEIDTKKYPTEKVPVSRKGKVGRPSGIAGGKYHKVG